MSSFAPFLGPPRCNGGQLDPRKRSYIDLGYPIARKVTVVRAIGTHGLLGDEAAHRSASDLAHQHGIVGLLLRVHVRTYLGLNRGLRLFSDAAFVDFKIEYRFYNIFFLETRDMTAPAEGMTILDDVAPGLLSTEVPTKAAAPADNSSRD